MATSRTVFARLGQEFIDQLLVEQAELAVILTRVQNVRAAILGRDVVRLEQASQDLDTQRAHYAKVGQRRQKLQIQLATLLEVPVERATLSRLQPLLDSSLRTRLDGLRRTLRTQTSEIDRLNRANLLIVRQLGDILQSAFDQLTGKPTAARYAPDGHLMTPEPVSLFQTDC